MSDLQLAGIKRNEAVSSVRTAEEREDPIYPGRERILLGPSPGRREGAGREPEVSSETVYQDDAEDYECETPGVLSGCGEEEMTELIKRYCLVCGVLMTDKMTAYDLVRCGAGTVMGDGSVLTHCRNHSPEEIRDALARDIRFHRASEAGK